MKDHLVLGKKGEQIAADYLHNLGYLIHDRNVRLKRDEIDIVAYDPNDKVIAFVEVKTRSENDEEFRPDLNMTPSKMGKLKRSARAWVQWRGYEGGYRIDAIYVAGGKVIDHIKEINGWQ